MAGARDQVIPSYQEINMADDKTDRATAANEKADAPLATRIPTRLIYTTKNARRDYGERGDKNRDRDDAQSFESLKASIKAVGLQEYPTVRAATEADLAMGVPSLEYWVTIKGNRRVRACQALGIAEIPCIVRLGGNALSRRAQWHENRFRKGLDAFEAAFEVADYCASEPNMTAKKAAEHLEVSGPYISECQTLAALGNEVPEVVEHYYRLLPGQRPNRQFLLTLARGPRDAARHYGLTGTELGAPPPADTPANGSGKGSRGPRTVRPPNESRTPGEVKARLVACYVTLRTPVPPDASDELKLELAEWRAGEGKLVIDLLEWILGSDIAQKASKEADEQISSVAKKAEQAAKMNADLEKRDAAIVNAVTVQVVDVAYHDTAAQ